MYHVLVALLQPFTLLYLFVALGLVVLWRRRKEMRRQLLLVSIPFVILGIICTPVVGYLALGSLERHYPYQGAMPNDSSVIVVLSGYVRPPDTTFPKAELGIDTLFRCLHAAQLYHRGGHRLVVVSGGKVDPSIPGPTLAQAMYDFLIDQGVNEKDLLMEDRSRTTYENALYTGELLSQRGINKIVLVTSTTHMWRAEGCFRAQGFEITPAACDYRASWPAWSVTEFLPDPQAVAGVQLAVHEWLGILWYWLHGRLWYRPQHSHESDCERVSRRKPPT